MIPDHHLTNPLNQMAPGTSVTVDSTEEALYVANAETRRENLISIPMKKQESKTESKPSTESKPLKKVELMTIKPQMSRDEIRKNLIAYLERQGLKILPSPPKP